MIPYIAGFLMAAGAAVCIYAGLWPFTILVAFIGILMAYEHASIVFGEQARGIFVLEATSLVAAPVAVAMDLPWAGFALLCATALASTYFAKSSGVSKRWAGWAFLYIGIALMAVVWLRDHNQGTLITFWLFLSIWATDSLAQITGRRIGGPKLAPIVSPNKTWSGLFGGIFGAIVVGIATGLALQGEVLNVAILGLLGACIAVSGQAGDLLESAFKRHFKVKDSSNLIPGHGGVLDRVDGLALAAILMAIFVWLFGGDLFESAQIG